MYGDGLTAKGHPLEEALRKKLEGPINPFEYDLIVKDRKPGVVPKVGDKVRIKSRAWYDKWETFGVVDVECDFIGYMAKFCGRIMKVRNVRDGVFKLDEDSASYNWSLEMFEEVYPQIKLDPGMLSYKDADPYRPLTAVEAAENFRLSKPGELVCKIDASINQQIIEQFLAFPVRTEDQEPELNTIKRHRFIKLKKD
jgi:hypothetical protein